MKSDDIKPAFDRAVDFGAMTFVNGVDSFIDSCRFDFAAEAEKRNLPATLHPGRSRARFGFLISGHESMLSGLDSPDARA